MQKEDPFLCVGGGGLVLFFFSVGQVPRSVSSNEEKPSKCFLSFVTTQLQLSQLSSLFSKAMKDNTLIIFTHYSVFTVYHPYLIFKLEKVNAMDTELYLQFCLILTKSSRGCVCRAGWRTRHVTVTPSSMAFIRNMALEMYFLSSRTTWE